MTRDLFTSTALTRAGKYELGDEFISAIRLALLGLLLSAHWLDVNESFVQSAHHVWKEIFIYPLEMRPL